jgi:hypothetical protein
MLDEHMIDMEASYGEMWVGARRCVNCGYRDDAVMQQHRLAQAPQNVGTPHVVTLQEHVNISWEPASVESLAA